MTASMDWVEKNGTAARGKREYLAFLRGEHLTLKQRVLANCYECTGMYTDGREDCDQENVCLSRVHAVSEEWYGEGENLVRRNESKTEGRTVAKRRKYRICCRGMSSRACFRP